MHPTFLLFFTLFYASSFAWITNHHFEHKTFSTRSSLVVTKGTQTNEETSSNTIWTDEEFQSWILRQLQEEAGPVLYEKYGGEKFFGEVSRCITKWRKRYQEGDNGVIWKRLFKKDRVVKEIIESIPIIHAIDGWVSSSSRDEPVTIIDLCSGKGYLSMLLSEYLPSRKVKKFILIDKAWPMCFAEPQPHHINWDHIYGNYTTVTTDEITTKKSYFSTWPIPLHTSKQDLKQKSTIRQLQKRLNNGGPTFILGVHLCGTLSIQAVKLFHTLDSVEGLILKPCCLPGMLHERRQENFMIGQYAFPTKEVCSPGKWKNKQWDGPPRWHLEKKFNTWCHHLHQGMQDCSNVETRLVEIPVQTSGGFQNTFLFAEKQPKTSSLWDRIPQDQEATGLFSDHIR